MLAPAVLMTALSQCLCEALGKAEYPYPEPCFCGVIPGTIVIPEMMAGCSSKKNGMAWVRLVLAYPSNTVGVIDQRPNNCGTGLGYDIEVGVLRDHTLYYESAVATVEDMSKVATWQSDDMMAIRRAITCCEALESEDYVIGQYQPTGPQGGVVGGAWQIHVGLL